MREWFVFYFSWFDAIKLLPQESQLEALTSIIWYAKDWKEMTIEDPLANAIFTMAQPQIDANEKRYTDWKKWGRPKKQGSTKKETFTESTTHTTQKETVKEKTEFEKTLDEFIKMRKAIKKPITDEWIKLVKQKLEKMYPWNETLQIQVLQNSISNSRQGVFPLKEGDDKYNKDNELVKKYKEQAKQIREKAILDEINKYKNDGNENSMNTTFDRRSEISC